jgi:hypothetical protein
MRESRTFGSVGGEGGNILAYPAMCIVRSPRCRVNRGQHRCDRQGKGTSVRPGSGNGAKAQDGSTGDLRDPNGVHVK